MIRFEFHNGLVLDFTNECAKALASINWIDNTLNVAGMAWRAIKAKRRELLRTDKEYTSKLREDTEYVRQVNEVYESIQEDKVTMEFTVTAELTTKSVKSLGKYDNVEHEYTLYYINGVLVAAKRDDGAIIKGNTLTIPYDEVSLISELDLRYKLKKRWRDLETKLINVVSEFGFKNFYADIRYRESEEYGGSLHSFDIGEEFE